MYTNEFFSVVGNNGAGMFIVNMKGSQIETFRHRQKATKEQDKAFQTAQKILKSRSITPLVQPMDAILKDVNAEH